MFKIECENSLSSKCGTRYKGIAYDGCHFYLTASCKCKVIKLDSCYNEVECFDTCRCYTAICYDKKHCCFWAAAENCSSTIYKLNKCFEEIDSIKIHKEDICGDITGISYNCCDNSIAVAFITSIIVINIDKACQEQSKAFETSDGELLMDVVSVCPFIICRCLTARKQTLQIFSKCGKLLHKIDLPNGLNVEAIVFYPCKKYCTGCLFSVLAYKKNRYPYILECSLMCDALCNKICDCNYEICEPCCH